MGWHWWNGTTSTEHSTSQRWSRELLCEQGSPSHTEPEHCPVRCPLLGDLHSPSAEQCHPEGPPYAPAHSRRGSTRCTPTPGTPRMSPSHHSCSLCTLHCLHGCTWSVSRLEWRATGIPQQELWLFISSLCLSVPHPSLVLAANPMGRAGTRREQQQGQGWSHQNGISWLWGWGTRHMVHVLHFSFNKIALFYVLLPIKAPTGPRERLCTGQVLGPFGQGADSGFSSRAAGCSAGGEGPSCKHTAFTL